MKVGLKKKAGFDNFFTYLMLIIGCIVFFYPFIYLLANSLRNLNGGTPLMLPKEFHFENYYLAVTLIPFMLYLKNTIILLCLSMPFSIVMNLMFGYAFARMSAPGKNFWFTVLLAQLMLPAIAISIPQYIFYSQVGLKDTYWIWILGGLGGNAFFTFLYRQYFANLPKELEDSARIDGCNTMGIIWKIFVPLSKPVIAIIVFSDFQGIWNDYMTPYMFLSEKKYPLSIALFGAKYVMTERPELQLQPVMLASATLLAIPIIVFFFLAQKQLVEGIATTGLKV